MARELWTAAEMERLSRDQQQAISDECIVTDLNEMSDQVRSSRLSLSGVRGMVVAGLNIAGVVMAVGS